MHGVPNYDILQESKNAEKFMYIPSMFPEREIFVTMKYEKRLEKLCAIDLPRVVTDFPYLFRD